LYLVAGLWGASAVTAAVKYVPVPASLEKGAQSDREDFPEPEELRSAVAFWKRVYLEVTTQGGLLHDSRHLGVVYETIRFEGKKSRRARQRQVDTRRRHWRAVLRGMANGKQPRNQSEEAVLHLLKLELGHTPTPSDLRRAARQVRFQLGQRDKFREGIIRSGAYENVMRSIFRQRDLPEDLAILPHVESSFNLKAYSKYGAAGVWQFMRSTGRRFMRIDYIVDERLDPIVATHAAARLLKENYESLGTWPLAMTAYNHGVAGMRRAKRKVGTTDFARIVKEYRSRTFGFASRNFYAQFLAARQVMQNYESYFGPLERDAPEVVDEVTLPFFLDVKTLRNYLGVAPEVVQHYNLGLRPPVFRSGKRIPRGYVLRLPAGTVGADPDKWLAAIPKQHRHKAQRRSQYYTVRRGDTLSKIASRNGTSVSRLVAINNLSSRHRIYPGQTLQLPHGKRASGSKDFALVKPAQARTKPKPIPKQKIDPVDQPRPALVGDSPFRRLDGDYVLVDASETLGHFAEWLDLPTRRLRELNRLSSRRKLRFGQRLRLDFSRVSKDTFMQRRIEFHKAIEEDFFGTFSVAGTVDHELTRGDSLWLLSHRIYRVPVWLIQSYNREVDLTNLSPGETLKIPVVERTTD
jgi:membrane-bound lytic murein transglycosylase D